MESRARFLGHPVHQMLVVFPAGLLATSVVFDIIYLAGESPTMAVVAFYLVVAGVIGGLLAAPFGLVDWMAIPSGTRARRIGAMHGGGNALALVLFIASGFLRGGPAEAPPILAHVLSFAGGGLMLVTAWLGGELVDRLGIGVSDHVGVNASSSLQPDRPATARAR